MSLMRTIEPRYKDYRIMEGDPRLRVNSNGNLSFRMLPSGTILRAFSTDMNKL